MEINSTFPLPCFSVQSYSLLVESSLYPEHFLLHCVLFPFPLILITLSERNELLVLNCYVHSQSPSLQRNQKNEKERFLFPLFLLFVVSFPSLHYLKQSKRRNKEREKKQNKRRPSKEEGRRKKGDHVSGQLKYRSVEEERGSNLNHNTSTSNFSFEGGFVRS